MALAARRILPPTREGVSEGRTRWIPTALWHAKRFHMVQNWGWRLPFAPTDKMFKALQRATTECVSTLLISISPLPFSGFELISVFNSITFSSLFAGTRHTVLRHMTMFHPNVLHVFLGGTKFRQKCDRPHPDAFEAGFIIIVQLLQFNIGHNATKLAKSSPSLI